MSFPGGSPDEDAMLAKGCWVDATRRQQKIGFGQGSFADGAGWMPQGGPAKKSVSTKGRLRMELG